MKKAILAYYPETNSEDLGPVETLVSVLKEIRDIIWTVILPQNDVGSARFINALKQLAEPRHFERSEFLDRLRDADFVVGNSSAFVIEAPCIGTPSILIGNRQKGRLMAASIIHCESPDKLPLALEQLYSEFFQNIMKSDYYTPYRGGNVAGKIADIILERAGNIKVQKEFHDLL